MPYMIVEYTFDPPITDDGLGQVKAVLDPCLDVRGVRRLRTFVSADRRHGFCEYVTPDAESVREAYQVAKVKYARAWAADLYGPP